GIGVLGWWVWELARPEHVFLYISDTHGPAASNRALASRLRAEHGVSVILHGGDIADAPGLYGPWWEVPFHDMPATVHATTGNHDPLPGFVERFGDPHGKVLRLGGTEIYFLPWGWGQAHADQFNDRVSRSVAANRIVLVHRPLFPAGGWQRLMPGLRLVNLVLAGHDHVSWDQTFDVGRHFVRQIIEVSGPKKYRCPVGRPACVAGTTGYLRIEAGRGLRVERVVIP
ncbi:metallophosphoesterase, partial [bacterium]|nr:metallophosphoesterase [bacterium]